MAKILDKQNIFDVVLQETGGINSSARVLRDNGLNFNDSIPQGSVLDVDALESQRIKDNYGLKNFNPNNDELSPAATGWILENGIWDDAGTWIDSEVWQDS